MYTLSVPFMLDQVATYGADGFIEELRKIGADTVFLALDCYLMDEKKREAVFLSLKKNVPLFKEAGFRVGVWVWTFMIREKNDFVHITSPNGKVSREEVCPSDAAFRAFSYEYLKSVAESHPDIILFDDDFTLAGFLFQQRAGDSDTFTTAFCDCGFGFHVNQLIFQRRTTCVYN